MDLGFIYAGTVEAVNDPERLGRLKVRVPAVFGPPTAAIVNQTSINSVATNDLPWALPAGLPAGGTIESGGMVWLPSVGDHVFCAFLDGLPEQPVWWWGNQDTSQTRAYPYWRRSPGGYTDTAPPDAAALTRYGHLLELSPGGVLLATSAGYALNLTDAQNGSFGIAQLITAKGYQHTFDDNLDRLLLFVPSYTGLVQTLNFTGLDYAFTAANTFQISTGAATVSAGQVDIKSATYIAGVAVTEVSFTAPYVSLGSDDADDAVVRLSDLRAAVNTIMAWANSHVHIGNLNRPTSPTIPDLSVTPTGSSVSFTV